MSGKKGLELVVFSDPRWEAAPAPRKQYRDKQVSGKRGDFGTSSLLPGGPAAGPSRPEARDLLDGPGHHADLAANIDWLNTS